MFIISFYIPMSCITYSSSYTFFAINNIPISVKRYNFTLIFFKAACYAYPEAERNFAGSSFYILIQIFLKLSNISANNNLSLWTYPEAERNFAGSSFYILIHIFLKLSNISANNNLSLWTYKS